MIDDGAMIDLHGRCIRSPVQTADKRPRFHLNQMVKDQFIVEIATRNIDHQEDLIKNIIEKLRMIFLLLALDIPSFFVNIVHITTDWIVSPTILHYILHHY